MHPQREKAAGPGLPATTCATDLFSRIDALAVNKETHADFPVRYYLGFDNGSPFIEFVRPNSFVGNLYSAARPDPAFPNWVNWARVFFGRIGMLTIWALGALADIMVTAKKGPGGCVDPRLKEIKADIAAKELVGKIFGSDVSWYTQIDQYARNYICPTETIDAGQALDAYLHDAIDRQALTDYTRASNRCPFVADVAIEIGQQRPGPQEIIGMHFRGVLPRHEVDVELRRQGWLSKEYVSWLVQLHDWWPDLTTTIDWMRRDLAGDDRAKAWGLDQDFAGAKGADANKWLKQLGVSDADAKRLFRAQYQPVDVQTAYNFYWRSQAGLMPAGATFSDGDLRDAIKYSTLPPRYRDAAYAARWSPLGFRQLKLAYDEFLIGDAGVKQALVAAGFAPQFADIEVAQYAKLRPSYRRRKIGAAGAAAFTKAFAAGSIGTREYLAELAAEGFTAEEQQEALQEARAERRRHSRAELVKHLHSHYIQGTADDATVGAALAAIGLDTEDARELHSLWRIELETNPRQHSGGQLVAWYQAGLMREAELVASLLQLRYSAADVARIVTVADRGKISKELTDAEKLVTAAKRSLSAEQKQWATQIKEAEKLVGSVSARTVTRAGKLLNWVQRQITGTPKPAAKKGPPEGGVTNGGEAAIAEAAAFVDPGVESIPARSETVPAVLGPPAGGPANEATATGGS